MTLGEPRGAGELAGTVMTAYALFLWHWCVARYPPKNSTFLCYSGLQAARSLFQFVQQTAQRVRAPFEHDTDPALTQPSTDPPQHRTQHSTQHCPPCGTESTFCPLSHPDHRLSTTVSFAELHTTSKSKQ